MGDIVASIAKKLWELEAKISSGENSYYYTIAPSGNAVGLKCSWISGCIGTINVVFGGTFSDVPVPINCSVVSWTSITVGAGTGYTGATISAGAATISVAFIGPG